jgi:hypothetical protein
VRGSDLGLRRKCQPDGKHQSYQETYNAAPTQRCLEEHGHSVDLDLNHQVRISGPGIGKTLIAFISGYQFSVTFATTAANPVRNLLSMQIPLRRDGGAISRSTGPIGGDLVGVRPSWWL